MVTKIKSATLKPHLDRLYAALNRREYVSPDPLQFLYDYADPLDREIVGLIASSLAYGRVAQILRSVKYVLDRMQGPRKFLADTTPAKMQRAFVGFKHRFTIGDEMAALLAGARHAIRAHGSLGACFASLAKKGDEDVRPALARFVDELNKGAAGSTASLLPEPSRGSACKRLHLYLRWMVRSDEVDPGGWDCVAPSKLIIPLDTHMHRICGKMGLTKRRPADARTAKEITEAFRKFSPEDPVRYDFAITRLGIRNGMDLHGYLGHILIR
ncbi:MAG: TIGR02757 family protein [bacterium]